MSNITNSKKLKATNKDSSNLENLNCVQNKLRLITTMPSSAQNFKMSDAEIKRRLALLRYPIIILGKDEVSSTIHVEDYEPPQFNGLNEHIWPFMINWCKKHTHNLNKNINGPKSLIKPNVLNKNAENTVEKPLLRKRNNGKCIGTKDINVNLKTNNRKPLYKIKDHNTLEILYKKSSSNVIKKGTDETIKFTIDNYKQNKNKIVKCLDASTQSDISSVKQNNRITKICANSRIKSFVWSKSRQYNDIIENVIRKIRHGAYSNNEFTKRTKIHLLSTKHDKKKYSGESYTFNLRTKLSI